MTTPNKGRTMNHETLVSLNRLMDEIAQLRRDGLADTGATRLCRIVEALIVVLRDKEALALRAGRAS
jgi:hypothetical protein